MRSILRRTFIIIGSPGLALLVSYAIWVFSRGEARCLAEPDVPFPPLICSHEMHLFTEILMLGGVQFLVLLPALWITRHAPRGRRVVAGFGAVLAVALTIGLVARRIAPVGVLKAIGETLELIAPVVVLTALTVGFTRSARPR